MPRFLDAVNAWPQQFGGLDDAQVDRIRKRLARAERFSHPTTMTTMADRIMGEVALRYQLPQDVRDLLVERDDLRDQLAHMQNLMQDSVKPQEAPPKTDRRMRP